MPLDAYEKKRNFNITSEPQGKEGDKRLRRFVVQEHRASHLHWDFRLEIKGVLKSWAVPKGMPLEKGVRHLAVETEDHPLEYISFEGSIPSGEYGAGTVKIWDTGTFSLNALHKDKIEFLLQGNILSGNYVLLRFLKAGKNNWLIMKT